MNLRNKKGETALHKAAGAGHAGIVIILSARKLVNVNVQTNIGYTTLHYVAQMGYHEIAVVCWRIKK